MTRDIHSMLAYEAKRRPAVAALVERAPFMTDAEIDAADVPLPWYCRALKALAAKTRSADIECMTLTGMEGRAQAGFTPDPVGEMRRWTGDAYWLPMGRSQIEILPNQLLWFPKTGGVWLDTVFSAGIATACMTMTVSVGEATRSAYKEAFRGYRDGLANALTPHMHLTKEVGGEPERPSPLAAFGVRISR